MEHCRQTTVEYHSVHTVQYVQYIVDYSPVIITSTIIMQYYVLLF